MKFTVIEVTDGDTFRVTPSWKWGAEVGDQVRPLGYDTPEQGQPGFDDATKRLKDLLLNRTVELSSPIRVTYGRLLCEVHIEGKRLADYFPEYE